MDAVNLCKDETLWRNPQMGMQQEFENKCSFTHSCFGNKTSGCLCFLQHRSNAGLFISNSRRLLNYPNSSILGPSACTLCDYRAKTNMNYENFLGLTKDDIPFSSTYYVPGALPTTFIKALQFYMTPNRDMEPVRNVPGTQGVGS